MFTIEILIIIFLLLLLIYVSGRMNYYEAQAETRLETIEELKQHNLLLSYINNDKAAEFVHYNF